MAITHLDEKAQEMGSYGIRCDFVEKTPEGNYPFTPNSDLKWSLYDKNGNPINNKTDEPLTPAQSVTIVLQGNDLALTGGSSLRYVMVECTYNGILGNNIIFIKEISFQIDNLKGKP